jgi:hypothetical protein
VNHEWKRHSGRRDPAGVQPRGRSAGQIRIPFTEGTNLVLLDPDVAEIFPDAESVNRALRALAQIIRDQAPRSAA